MSPVLSSYSSELDYLYNKSLILESPSEMHPVLYFYFIDALAHLDYTLSALAHNTDSIKCTMTGEYLRGRVDKAKSGDNALFPKFMVWLKDTNREAFENTPILWQLVYDPEEESKYIGFRFVLDPNTKTPLPPNFFHDMADDLFQTPFLRSIYPEGSLGKLFEEFKKQQ